MISRGRFIRLGLSLGAGAASGAVLAACGGTGGGSGSPGSGRKGTSSTGKAIAKARDVPPGSAVKFTSSGQPAVLIHLKTGRFVAYSAVCTHMGCTVAYQKSSGDLVCPCHGSVYDPAHGAKVLRGPAPRPLPKIPVKMEGGEVVKT
ncbi:ubiquinol-cytochrome c reductase iron-sulfur subunit [Rubrobacter calidifluminis]|uniref:QcrA and Rieske domain-containing protein n=1 Tax=Rubrobacter calidifluminis TaxID=1392640 RepID=UPI00236238DC|nr:Rieske (2Fe-2S) protein [Rubrobacter calidifluminis]